MKNTTLFRALLSMCKEPEYEIALNHLKITPTTLSRCANGLTARRSTLQKAAAFFSQQLDDLPIDAALLQTQLGPRELIGFCVYLQSRRKPTDH